MTSQSQKKHRRILYIEDDPSNRQLVRLLLDMRPNLELVEAETALEGLEQALHNPFDIILLDLSFPDISGYEVLGELQSSQLHNTTPVIAVSGDNMPDDIERGKQAGFFAYLTKPLDALELSALLDHIFASMD
ncbi:MAG: response regulator [Desulfopila sp.]